MDFDPALGAEMQKTRPAVVISGDGIGRLPLKIVVPITDWKTYYGAYAWFVRLVPSDINGLTKESGADAFQVTSVSTDRFVRKVGILHTDELRRIASAIAMCVEYKVSEG